MKKFIKFYLFVFFFWFPIIFASPVQAYCEAECLIVSSPVAVYDCTLGERCNTCPPCVTSGTDPNAENKIHNPVLPLNLTKLSGTSFLSKIISTGITISFIIGSLAFIFMFFEGAILWITSQGDKTRLENSQKEITHAITGLAILFLLFAIIKIINIIFGINLTSINIPTLNNL